MPTDGADFGRKKACYGKAYREARAGAPVEEVARLLVKGVERDVRRDGGMPVFGLLVNTLVLMTQKGGQACQAPLQERLAALGDQFADSGLTRHGVAVAEKIGLACLHQGVRLNEQVAAERILTGLAESRCEGLAAYVARGALGSISSANNQVQTTLRQVAVSADVSDLASRMLRSNERGLPAKPARTERISHDAAELNNAVIGAL